MATESWQDRIMGNLVGAVLLLFIPSREPSVALIPSGSGSNSRNKNLDAIANPRSCPGAPASLPASLDCRECAGKDASAPRLFPPGSRPIQSIQNHPAAAVGECHGQRRGWFGRASPGPCSGTGADDQPPACFGCFLSRALFYLLQAVTPVPSLHFGGRLELLTKLSQTRPQLGSTVMTSN